MPQLFAQSNNSQPGYTHQSLQIVQHDNQPFIVLSHRKQRQNLMEEPHSLELSEKLVYDDAGYFIRHETGQWQPRYNLYKDDNKICLILELPGFKEGECQMSMSEDAIIIAGTRSDMNDSMAGSIIRQSDIPSGSFKLKIEFTCKLDRANTTSKRADGFITITAAKKKLDWGPITI